MEELKAGQLMVSVTLGCYESKTSNCYAGYRIAQVRVVFQIPRRAINKVAPLLDTSPHLAYVEWFSFAADPDTKHGMFKITRQTRNGRRNTSIIDVDSILSSVHLFPRFGPTIPLECNSFTALDCYSTFYVNPFADIDSYLQCFSYVTGILKK